MNIFIIIDIRKPKSPIMEIPAAETFATFKNSSLVGFFKTIHTLLHFAIKFFRDSNIFIVRHLRFLDIQFPTKFVHCHAVNRERGFLRFIQRIQFPALLQFPYASCHQWTIHFR